MLKYNLYHIINIALDLNELEYLDFIYMIFANHESFYICRVGNEPSEPSHERLFSNEPSQPLGSLVRDSSWWAEPRASQTLARLARSSLVRLVEMCNIHFAQFRWFNAHFVCYNFSLFWVTYKRHILVWNSIKCMLQHFYESYKRVMSELRWNESSQRIDSLDSRHI